MSDVQDLCASVECLQLTKPCKTLDYFVEIMENNEYVRNCTPNKQKQNCSLSSLVDKPISHSECIKLGLAIEKVLRDIISFTFINLKDIKSKNVKGYKEKDHLFLDEQNKVIYYAEIKANLNLDTEKNQATVNKCNDIKLEMSERYPDHTVKMFLVCGRFLYASDIPKSLKKKYSKIDTNIVGVFDYLNAYGFCKTPLTEEEYRKFINITAQKLFEKSEN